MPWKASIQSPRPSTSTKPRSTGRTSTAQVRWSSDPCDLFYILLRAPSLWASPPLIQSGFRADFPYPHAHTVYFLDGADTRYKLNREAFRAKMLMFTFGNALARAHILYGVRRSTRPNVLSPSPVLLELKTFCYTVCVCVSDAAPECVKLSHHRPGCGNQREDFPVFGFPAQHHRPDRRPWCEEPGISSMSRTEQNSAILWMNV